jgi:hypothetical protein
MTDYDLSIIKGNSKNYRLAFETTSGDALDITGYTVFFTVKKNVNQTDDQAIISKTNTTHSNPTGGISIITITTTDTSSLQPGVYLYDIGYVNAAGTAKKTSDPEKFEVIGNITRRNS